MSKFNLLLRRWCRIWCT